MQIGARNTPNISTAEHKGMKSAYNALAAPALSARLSVIPSPGPVSVLASGAAVQFGTSQSAGDGFAALMALRMAGALRLPRLSRITMSPAQRRGQNLGVIGVEDATGDRPVDHPGGAVMPLQRKATTKVMVFRWPKGCGRSAACRAWTRGAMLVLAWVSSMKTRR